ncbi:MAG TPA: FecR domain-containing protein [Polyangiaceae bacterium]|nr:FecR domain-containing protein [Polyangiaceae bacterium]
MKSELSKYVALDLSSARVARLWPQIEPRVRLPRRHRPWLMRGALVGALALGVGAGALVVRSQSGAESVFQNAVLETQSDRLSVNLGEGSNLELSAETRVSVRESAAHAVRLRLERGSVVCDVSHLPGRHFSVEASGVEVRVVGTRFRVTQAPGRVQVAVERGAVEVRPHQSKAGNEYDSLKETTVHRISAGESLELPALPSTVLPSTALPSTPNGTAPLARPTSSNSVVTGSVVNDSAVSKSAVEPRRSGNSLAERTPHLASRGNEGPQTSGSARSSEQPAAAESVSTSSNLQRAGAAELLEIANAARRGGDLVGAARAYEALLSRFPADARSGLAAFELGRLRLDRLGNPRGAVQAFERAIALAPGAGFREDAMARLVDAYSALGAVERCKAARKSYLNSYPNGVRATAMAVKCGSADQPK